MDEKLRVDMDGKEYLELKRFQHEKRTKLKLSKFGQGILIMAGSVMFGTIALAGIIQSMTPKAPVTPMEITGITILFILSLGLAVGWAVHGVGFLIVKVGR